MKAFAVLLIVAVVLGGVFGVMYVSISNSEIRLRNEIKAQQKTNETVFDTTWKIIQQQAQVADQYKDGFKQVYGEIMDKRYSPAQGGTLLRFITESNPNFDSSLYAKVANSIEGQRLTFQRAQAQLLDLKREHDNVRLTFPGSLVCGGRPEIEVQIVTSGKTAESFQTGREDNVDLFTK